MGMKAALERDERMALEAAAPAEERSKDAARPVTVIRPSRGWVPVNLRELWEYRELLYFLTWRDLKVRYKQTVFGAAWAIIQPLFMFDDSH